METTYIEGFRLSPQQRRLWRSWPEPAAVVAQAIFRLEGDLDRAALRRALADVVARHEILRTTYRFLQGMDLPLQVLANPDLTFRELPPAGGEDALRRLLGEEAAPFDLEKGPTARFALQPLGAGGHLLTVTLPAGAADDRSFDNLLAEVAKAYGWAMAGTQEGGDVEEASTVQYADVSEWQNEMLEEPETNERRDFWRRQEPSRGDSS